MAYDIEKLKAKCIEVAIENKCIFIEDVCAYSGVSKQTFYNHKLDSYEPLQSILNNHKYDKNNRINCNNNDRINVIHIGDVKNITQINLYKLCLNEDELQFIKKDRV